MLVLDLDDAEARKLLAVHDPLAAMAQPIDEVLSELLGTVEADDADLRRLLDQLMPAERSPRGPAEGEAAGPVEMQLAPHEHYDYVIVLARNTHEWNRLVELLDLGTVRRIQGRIGVGRGLPAARLIAMLEDLHNHGNSSDRGPQPPAREEHAPAPLADADGAGGRRPGRTRGVRGRRPQESAPDP